MVSISFDVPSASCTTCLTDEHEAWQRREGGPIAFVLTDQHFPANAPASGEGECLRVVRIEDGSLWELADELLRIVCQS